MQGQRPVKVETWTAILRNLIRGDMEAGREHRLFNVYEMPDAEYEDADMFDRLLTSVLAEFGLEISFTRESMPPSYEVNYPLSRRS